MSSCWRVSGFRAGSSRPSSVLVSHPPLTEIEEGVSGSPSSAETPTRPPPMPLTQEATVGCCVCGALAPRSPPLRFGGPGRARNPRLGSGSRAGHDGAIRTVAHQRPDSVHGPADPRMSRGQRYLTVYGAGSTQYRGPGPRPIAPRFADFFTPESVGLPGIAGVHSRRGESRAEQRKRGAGNKLRWRGRPTDSQGRRSGPQLRRLTCPTFVDTIHPDEV